MSDIEINYKGSSITTMDASGTKTLLTEGKYCEDDIEVVYTKPSAPTPTLQSKNVSYSPSLGGTVDTVTADAGYDGLNQVKVTVSSMPQGSLASQTSLKSGDLLCDVWLDDETGTVYGEAVLDATVKPVVTEGYIRASAQTDIIDGADKTYQLDTQAATAITPTESQQTAVAKGKYTLGAVTVNAIPSNYVGSGITQRSSSDLTASGATVTAPSGYYASSASKSVASMTLPSTTSNNEVGTMKADIFPSTADTTYLNIPAGYNSTAQHYKIRALMLDSKSVTTNGTYSAASDDLDGFSSVTVSVPTVTITQSGSNLSIV